MSLSSRSHGLLIQSSHARSLFLNRRVNSQAAEPVFTCVLSFFVLGTVFKWPVYASLLPIVAGVSLASLKELSFTWKALYGAVTSNVAFASRAVRQPRPPRPFAPPAARATPEKMRARALTGGRSARIPTHLVYVRPHANPRGLERAELRRWDRC